MYSLKTNAMVVLNHWLLVIIYLLKYIIFLHFLRHVDKVRQFSIKRQEKLNLFRTKFDENTLSCFDTGCCFNRD